MRHVQFGFVMPADQLDKTRRATYVEDLDRALSLVSGHFDSAWIIDHLQFDDAACQPRPDPRPPIMVGAFKPKMLRLTARHADWWNVSSTGAKTYRRMIQEMERACADVGRDPATVRRTWSGGCACAPTHAQALRLAGDRRSADSDEDFDFVGTPQQVLDQMQPFVDLGVDYFMLDCGGFPELTTLETLVSEVLPAWNGGR